MNIEVHYLKYDSRHLSRARARTHTFVCICIYMRAHSGVGQLLSVCQSFFFFSISIDVIAQSGERKERERKFDDDVYSMASRA